MANLEHLIKYHEEKLRDARKTNNGAAINHHEQALHFLKRHRSGSAAEVKND